VRALWEQTENISLNESDEEPAVTGFLIRNPELSPVALAPDGRVVGAMLCGHDGRRGYLHHLAVAREWRGRGLGRQLVEFAIAGLRQIGIPKCNLFVLGDSHAAVAFWEHQGWKRPEWLVLQRRLLGCGAGDGGTC
jgi:putative acetyltransferase